VRPFGATRSRPHSALVRWGLTMSYLRRKRSQIIIGAFVSFSLFAVLVPSLDLAVSRFFFNGVAFPRGAWWVRLQQDLLTLFLSITMLAVVLVYAWNRLLRRRVLNIDGRRVLYLLFVLIIGAGLIVNAGFKNNFGRARPRDVAEFGGSQMFTPAYVVSRECETNCSFSSGDAAGGFFTIALVMAFQRRRVYYVAAGALGVVISIARLASGAHFLSDIVVSFFVMLIVSDVLFHYMIAIPSERRISSSTGEELVSAYASTRDDSR
jgi:lipid A 4'-phosphatase